MLYENEFAFFLRFLVLEHQLLSHACLGIHRLEESERKAHYSGFAQVLRLCQLLQHPHFACREVQRHRAFIILCHAETITRITGFAIKK